MPGIAWPAIPGPDGALMMALQYQFQVAERSSPDVVRGHQFHQLALLAEHAYARSPFWRERLRSAGYRPSSDAVETWFRALPPLTRGEARSAGRALLSASVPPGHGSIFSGKTSGSTTEPLTYYKTDAAMVFWHAFTLRDSLWHARDLRAKLAVIRVGSPRQRNPGWGPAYSAYLNGPCVLMDARDDIDLQVDWLVQEKPQYLLTHASNLRALAVRCIERGLRLESLAEARSYSERLPEDLRSLVRRAWNASLSDMYSANEVGYIALQCPRTEVYHVQSEGALVEVLDANGRACAPGAIGRVVVTPLHNFAMPLFRYDLGDFAEAGGPCACGRTLPVLTRIMGRTRNMMRLPGGGTVWPGFPLTALTRLTAIRQARMIQHSLDLVEVQLVLERPLAADEEEILRQAVRTRLGHPFEVRLSPIERIERGPGYKMEDFECRVT